MNTLAPLLVLGELLAKSSLIILIAAALVFLWKGASAARRHLVWLAAVCALLLLPFTLAIKPLWVCSAAASSKGTKVMPAISAPPAAEIEESPRAAVTPSAPARRWRWPDLRTLVVSLWTVGAGLILIQRAIGTARLRFLRASGAMVVDPRIRSVADGVFAGLGIRRPVEVRTSPRCHVPLTWGTRRPVLMLPAESPGITGDRLVATLRHEAAHIARHDYFTNGMMQLVCALYWPNPLVWLAARALHTAQEQSADDLVLNAGLEPAHYAAQLLDVARVLISRPRLATLGALAMARPSTLEKRMIAIVDEHRDRRPAGERAVAVGMAAALLVLVLSSTARLLGSEEAASPAPAQAQANPPQTEKDAGQLQIQIATSSPDDDPLKKIIIKNMEFKQEPLLVAANRLVAAAHAQGADSVDIIFDTPPDTDEFLAFSIKNMPIADAIQYVATASIYKVRREGDVFHLEEIPEKRTQRVFIQQQSTAAINDLLKQRAAKMAAQQAAAGPVPAQANPPQAAIQPRNPAGGTFQIGIVPSDAPAKADPAKTGAAMKISISGQVKTPSLLDLAPGDELTVSGAIIKAGGGTQFSNLRKVKLTRKDKDGTSKSFTVDVKAVLEEGKTEKDIKLEAGDVILVPPRLVTW